MYVHHPAFKWMPFNTKRMTIKLENLHDRMTTILMGNPEKSTKELESLIEEVIILVHEHLPELDICEQKKHMRYTK